MRCRTCGYKALADAVVTEDLSSPSGFVYLGEDAGGLLRYRCPSCGEVTGYTFSETRGRFYRTKRVLLLLLAVFGMAMMIFRFLHDLFFWH